ncbi:MAG: hypothetical protein ACM3RX_07180 [Methanococcaceae archaeon]
MRNTKLQYISIVTIALLSTLFIFNSCKHEGIPADQLPPVPFSKVQVIFSIYCGGCHDGKSDETRYNFNDANSIINSVVPYNSAKSKPYKAMISTFQVMPPDRYMPTSDKTLIRIWIDQGAKQ